MAVRKGKKRVVTVDFTGVESGGKAVPDGVYRVSVAEVSEEEGEKGPYLRWKFRVIEGSSKGAPIYDNTSLTSQSLWRLKGMLETMGVEVPESSLDLDLDEYVGQELTITVANETYQGKERPKVAQYGGAAEEKPREKSKANGELKVGQKVKFVDEGKTIRGKITQIQDESVTVESTDGEEWELDQGDLTAV